MNPATTVGAACGQGLPGASSARMLPAGDDWDGFLANLIDERAVPIVANALEQELLTGTRAQRDALLNSRSWRYAAPLRRLWALKHYLRPAA